MQREMMKDLEEQTRRVASLEADLASEQQRRAAEQADAEHRASELLQELETLVQERPQRLASAAWVRARPPAKIMSRSGVTQRLRHEFRHSLQYRPLWVNRRHVGPDHRQQSQSSPHFSQFWPPCLDPLLVSYHR